MTEDVLLRADLDETLRILFILLIVFGGLIKRVLEKLIGAAASKSGSAPAKKRDARAREGRGKPSDARGRQAQASVPEAGTGTAPTWEDLLRGNVPPAVDDVPAPPPAPEPEPEFGSVFEMDSGLDSIPSEGELETVGGDRGSLETADLEDSLLEFSAGEASLVDPDVFGRSNEGLVSDDFEPAVSPTRARLQFTAEDWRRAVVLNEIFGAPLGSRPDGGHPGPPLGLV